MPDNFIDRFIDRIFNLKRATIYLFIIFCLGFLLRLIAAINLSVAADDMHHTLHAINFFRTDKLVLYDQSSGLWHSFTNIIYEFFGISQISSRIASLVFGTLSILIIYLLTKEFFSRRVSLFAAFLIAIAPFHIKSTIAEMDVMTMFFVLTAMLFFVRGIKSDKCFLFLLSGIFLGLAVYTKVYPLLFIFSIIFYSIFYNYTKKRKIFTRNSIKGLVLLLLCVFIFAVPSLTHNYLLYKDKGFLDLIYTSTTGIGKNVSAQYYAWDSFFDSKPSWKGLFFGDARHIPSGTPLILGAINYIRLGDPINFYLSILGVFFIIFYRKKYRDSVVFFFLAITPLLVFLATRNLLPKHYLFLELFMVSISAFSFNEISTKLSSFFKRDISKVLLVIVLLFSLVYLGLPGNSSVSHFYSKSHISKMIEFKDQHISNDALIVGDSRIYRGRINWAFVNRPYLEGTDFITILSQQNQIAGEFKLVDVYYFECVQDDCGWGTVKNQPEFNNSMEELTMFFKQNGNLIQTIYEPDLESPNYPFITQHQFEYIRIYHMQLNLKNSILDFAREPKVWFLYNIGHEPVEKSFDYYTTNNAFDKTLNAFAHFVKLVAVILAFISIFLIIYFVLKDEVNNNHSSV